jgi:glycoside/pentoside/hexuronide:cation symporter, GPH family
MTQLKLPLSKQIAYAVGVMGWSIMINLISVILVYFYVPPQNSGLPILITQIAVFGVFNVMGIVAASGRLFDAIYDPLIAQFSDRSKNPKGRRIPLMKIAIIPSAVFCFLIFYPLTVGESSMNVVWLSVMLIGFYMASTTYIIPCYALLPEIAHDSNSKMQLSSWQSVGYVFGIGISSNAFNIADLFQSTYVLEARITALQLAVLSLVVLGMIFMLIPILTIDEKKYSTSVPSTVPLKAALRQILGNRNFRLFIVADFAYWIGITFITSGLIYFVTVLLELPESIGNKLMITLVLVSFVFYPIINILARKIGKKIIVVLSFLILGVVFCGIYFLGTFDSDPEKQIYLLIIIAAIPMASLNILPTVILADIIERDSKQTGENKEGIYFAGRFFFWDGIVRHISSPGQRCRQ